MKTRERITFSSLSFLRGIEAVAGEDVSNTFGKHIHNTFIVGLVTKGVRVITHEGGESRIPEGGLFFLNPGQVHACRSGDGGAHSYQLFSIASDVLSRMSSQISEKAEGDVWFEGVCGVHPEINQGICLFFEMLSDPLFTSFDKESHLYGLLSDILLTFAQSPPVVCHVGRQQESIERVRHHIQANHPKPLSLGSLASVACLSPFHLQRLFTHHYGISPHQYLTHTRISEAKKLLSEGHSIAEAALATGFADQSHLTNQFKRVVGTTPGRFLEGMA